MHKVTLYGISNCDTVRKARRWLDSNGIDYHFHDLRKDGLKKSLVQSWVRELGRDTLLNRRGTTWRSLPEAQRNIASDAAATALVLEHPALVKRPVLDLDGLLNVGFSETRYAELFD